MKKMTKKILYCCVNVFNISPTFLLPIFKELDKDIFYAQCSKNNIINNFEVVNIEQYELHSKIYYLDTNDYYNIGSDTVYSIDYSAGFFYGNRAQIISFYRNNSCLFDKTFCQYMSDFITTNSDIISKNNYQIIKSKNYTSLNDLLDIREKVFKELSVGPYNFYNDWIYRKKHSPFVEYYDKDIESGTPVDSLRYLINVKFSGMNNIQMFFNSPPKYYLWNDTIISDMVDKKDFYEMIGLEENFPEKMFLYCIKWKNVQLPHEVKKKIDLGYNVYYLNVKSLLQVGSGHLIVVQDYNDQKNHFFLYKHGITIKHFLDFTKRLSHETKKKVCYILDINQNEKNYAFLNNSIFETLLEKKELDIIVPPKPERTKLVRMHFH